MGELIDLGDQRAAREARRVALAIAAAMHPALRCTVGGDEVGHRRTPMGRTVCGAVGELRIADPDAPRCRPCHTRNVPA